MSWANFPLEIRYTATKIVGIGDAGISVIKYVAEQNLSSLDSITINSRNKLQARNTPEVDLLINYPDKVVHDLGFGGNAELGRRATEECVGDIVQLLGEADRVFIVCGMGGGLGTGASPIVAHIAKEIGATAIGVVTAPFRFEGSRRLQTAHTGIQSLSEETDSLTVIENDRLLTLVSHKAPLDELFDLAARMLAWHVLTQLV